LLHAKEFLSEGDLGIVLPKKLSRSNMEKTILIQVSKLLEMYPEKICNEPEGLEEEHKS